MATYYCRMSVGHGAKGIAHFKYIEREGKYRRHDKVFSETGNLPAWARSPKDFWEKVSAHDKRSYREIDFALPNELSPEEQKQIVQEFIKDYLPDKAYTMAIHEPTSRIKEEKNPHVHIMFSERTIDDRVRSMSETEFFKMHGFDRSGKEYGGSVKDNRWAKLGNNELLVIRQKIADRINAAYERNGLDIRISPKSIEEQRQDLLKAGNIEAAENFKRVKPYRAPVRDFIRHAKEIAAAGRGELDPETIRNPAARLRAYQEAEKNTVTDIAKAIEEHNRSLSPTEAERFLALGEEEERLTAIAAEFEGPNKDSEAAEAWRRQLKAVSEQRRLLLEKLRKEYAEGKEFTIRSYSIGKAEADLETAPKLNAADPVKEIRAVGAARRNVARKIERLSAETVAGLSEAEADTKTGGKITEIRRKIEALKYAALTRPQKDDERARLEKEKEVLVNAALTPKDWEELRQKAKDAEKKIWDLRRMADRLNRHLAEIGDGAGLTKEDVEKILAAQEQERLEREAAKAAELEKAEPEKEMTPLSPAPAKTAREPEMPETPEALRRKPERSSPAKEQSPEKQTEDTPDMRLLQRSIGDSERTIARLEKKVLALRAKTAADRIEDRADERSGGKLIALKRETAEKLKAGGRDELIRREYEYQKKIIVNTYVTGEERRSLKAAAEKDAKQADRLMRYIRYEQKQVIDRRAALARLFDLRRIGEKKAELEKLAAIRPEDLLRQAMKEYGAPSPAVTKGGGEKRTASEEVRDFMEQNLPAPVRDRAAALAEENRAGQEKLRREIALLEKKAEVRGPYESRYMEERKKLLDKAARRRAWLYEDTVLKLQKDPKRLSYWFDRVISEKTNGEMDVRLHQYAQADQKIRSAEKTAEAARTAREDLEIWKDIWEKKPLSPMKGKGVPKKKTIEEAKKDRQQAEAAVRILRKDFNTRDVWDEARKRYADRRQEEARLRTEELRLRKKIDRARTRGRITMKARAVLSHAARLADRLLGPKGRGESLGASIRTVGNKDIDLGSDI